MDTEHKKTPNKRTANMETLTDRYQIYLACADNGAGLDITTGEPLKTFDEWLNS